jgi:Tfp pilus assembly protein PilP
MKLTTGILAVVMMTGSAWAQTPAATANTSTAKSPQQQAAKPAPGAPAPAVKPAAIPGAKPAAVPAKAAVTPTAVPAASQNNTLQRVNVVRNADDVRIEIGSREAVTPKVDKLSSPARVVVELPATVMATAQSKISIGSAGVKGVRIGMDGKTPPTTSVVVDLEQALAYELTSGPGNTVVLTLHTKAADKPADKAVAKSIPASVPAKTSTPAPKLQVVATKPASAAPTVVPPAKSTPTPAIAVVKPHDVFVPQKPAPAAPVAVAKMAAPKPAPAAPVTVAKAVASKPVAVSIPAAKPVASAAPTKIAANEKAEVANQAVEAPKPPKPEEKKWAMNGKRDPFFSPVVQQPTGSGCSTGKKCLEIGQINLRGVVKSESGFIAVVTNSLNKAYFLHENDPVFNGYVVRITGDSVVFQETVPDKLGKPFTREVVKRITTPAV